MMLMELLGFRLLARVLPTDLRVERLERMLSVVKDLYSEKYGRDVDTEYDADGTAWKVTVGTGVPL